MIGRERHHVGMSPSADAAPEPLRDLVIRDVAVLDCTGREPSGRHDVEVRDGKIAAIRPAGERRARSR